MLPCLQKQLRSSSCGLSSGGVQEVLPDCWCGASQVVTRLIHLLGQKILQQVNGPLTGVVFCSSRSRSSPAPLTSASLPLQAAAWLSTPLGVSGTPGTRRPTCPPWLSSRCRRRSP